MATQSSWDDPGTDPGAGNRKAVPNATISSSMMNWILYTISMIDLPDLDGRLSNAETELQNARGSAASLDARLDAFLNEDGTPKKSQLEQGGAHELVGIVLQGADASKPAAGIAGRFWLSTDTKAFYYDDGTQWVLIGKLAGLDLSNHGARHKAGGPDAILPDTIANVLTDHDLANHTALGLEETANKGVANGYCELDANALVPVSRIPSLTRSKISDFFSSPFWGNIPDKPSTFPPSAHTHPVADLTDHTKAVHDSLGIDAATLGGKTVTDIISLLPQRDAAGNVVYNSTPDVDDTVSSGNTSTTGAWIDLYTVTWNKAENVVWAKFEYQNSGDTDVNGFLSGSTRIKLTDGVNVIYSASSAVSTSWITRSVQVRVRQLAAGSISVTVQGYLSQGDLLSARYMKIMRNLTEAE